MQNKILSLLGLARRAGKLDTGFEAVKSAARAKKSCLLLAAEDISEKTYKNLCYEGERNRVPVMRIPESTENISIACGIKAGVLSVGDAGFARGLRKAMEERNERKEECKL